MTVYKGNREGAWIRFGGRGWLNCQVTWCEKEARGCLKPMEKDSEAGPRAQVWKKAVSNSRVLSCVWGGRKLRHRLWICYLRDRLCFDFAEDPKTHFALQELALLEPSHILFPFRFAPKSGFQAICSNTDALVSHRGLFYWAEPGRLQGPWLCHSRPAVLLEPQRSGFESWCCHLLAVWPLLSYLSSLCLGFLIHKMGIAIVRVQNSKTGEIK